MYANEFYNQEDVDNVRDLEKLMINSYAAEFFDVLLNQSSVHAIMLMHGITTNIEAERCLAGIKEFLDKIAVHFRRYNGLAKNQEVNIERLGDAFTGSVKKFASTQGYIFDYSEFVNTAIKFEKFLGKKQSGDEFFLIANNYNRKMEEMLTRLVINLETKGSDGFDMDELSDILFRYSADIDLLDMSNDVKIKRELEAIERNKNMVIVKSEGVNQKEQERVARIRDANDLFERFKIDFLRDLEKEVSLMNRDMYDALISKFERFISNFQMPLSNETSLGMANEAYSQISNMIEKVYEISRNTYTPVVFGG